MGSALSPPWVRLTLDTSCVSALANPQVTNDAVEVEALEKVVDLAHDGLIRVQLTTAYERDFSRWKDSYGRERRLEWLSGAPPLSRAPGVVRLDVSVLGGGDVLGDDADLKLDQELRALLRPSLDVSSVPAYEDAPETAAKLFSDIDHLIAHHRV